MQHFKSLSGMQKAYALVMLLYPVLSVYPQGVIYRTFLMHRYRRSLDRRWF
jgi:uncharacterized protein